MLKCKLYSCKQRKHRLCSKKTKTKTKEIPERVYTGIFSIAKICACILGINISIGHGLINGVNLVWYCWNTYQHSLPSNILLDFFLATLITLPTFWQDSIAFQPLLGIKYFMDSKSVFNLTSKSMFLYFPQAGDRIMERRRELIIFTLFVLPSSSLASTTQL